MNYLMLKKPIEKNLNFCLAPKQRSHANYLVQFDLLYSNIRNLEVFSEENLGFVKTRTEETALPHLDNKNLNKIFKKKNLHLWQV